MTNVALIGVGMVSKAYAEALNNLADKVKLIGVMGSKYQSGKKFLVNHPYLNFKNSIVFNSIQEITESNIDFVILTTPPNQRIEIIKKLADKNLPILMEKPIERTYEKAKEIEKISNEKNMNIGIMFQHRARPSVLELKQKLSKEDFGPLISTEIYVPWWRDQSYYDQPGRGTYERDGGGVLISQAIHTIDLALQFTGNINAVTAMNKRTLFHSMESEDFVSAGLEFENNCVGNLFASTATYPGRTEEIILHYKKVSVYLQSNQLTLKWQNGKSETIGKNMSSGAGANPMAFTSDWHRDMILNFSNFLTKGERLLAPINSALKVHKLISLIEISSKKHTRITIGDLK